MSNSNVTNKKLFCETSVTTTHFLKSCVKVPKSILIDPSYEIDKPKDEDIKKFKTKEQSAFKRGVMNFEDYNYKTYNKHILVDPKKKSTIDQSIIDHSKKFNKEAIQR